MHLRPVLLFYLSAIPLLSIWLQFDCVVLAQDSDPNARAALMADVDRVKGAAAKVRDDVKSRDAQIPKNITTGLVAHFRGREGIPLNRSPSTAWGEKYRDKLDKGFSSYKAKVRSEYADYNPSAPTPYVSVFSTCPNKTERKDLHITGVSDPRKIHGADLLFLKREDLVARDVKPYGQSPTIISVDSPESQFSHLAQSMGVTCVPFRIRMVGGVEIRNFGAEALRDYDEDPLGQGKLAPVVKTLLEERKKGGR